MNTGIEYIASLLLIGALVAMAVRRLNVPCTVGLMLTGIILAVSPFPSGDIEITSDGGEESAQANSQLCKLGSVVLKMRNRGI